MSVALYNSMVSDATTTAKPTTIDFSAVAACPTINTRLH